MRGWWKPTVITHHILFIVCPLLEYLQREPSMEHARCGEHHHGARVVDVGAVKGLHRGQRSASMWGQRSCRVRGHAGSEVMQPALGSEVIPWDGAHFDVLELEHVPLHEGAANFLIGPRDEELVIVIRLST